MTFEADDIQRLAADRNAKINLLLAMNAMANLHLRDAQRALDAERVQLQSERAHHQSEARRHDAQHVQSQAEQQRLQADLDQVRAERDMLVSLRERTFKRRLRRQIALTTRPLRSWLTRAGK